MMTGKTTMPPMEIVTVRKSPIKLIFLIDLGILMTALSALVVPGLIPLPIAQQASVVFGVLGDLRYAVGYAGMIFFGLCTLGWIGRLLVSRGPVITLSPQGIRDNRIAQETIPWLAVTGVSVRGESQKVIVLHVDPLVEHQLTLTKIARYTRGMNAKLGADGLCISASGLQISFDRLHALIKNYRP